MSVTKEAERIKLDGCEHCRVTWFDKGELRNYRRRIGLPHERESTLRRKSRWTEEYALCPACDTNSLQRGRRGRRVIGHCQHCGGFLLPSIRHAKSRGLMTAFQTPASKVSAVVSILIFVLWILVLSL